MMRTPIEYHDGAAVCEGYLTVGDGGPERRPVVLVAHQWGGLSDHERSAAEDLARQGYLGLALDVYGKGIRGVSNEENAALMAPWTADRGKLRTRLLAAVDAAASHPRADPSRIAVIGFCFGGLCALDLARSGDPRVKAAVSIHGVLAPPDLGAQGPITASVLVQHGDADPMAPPKDLRALAEEMTAAKADWQAHVYGRTMHAFTAEGANAPEMGLAYNEKAARRSMEGRNAFLREVFAVG